MNKRLICLALVVAVLSPVVTLQAAELAHRWSFNGDLKDSVGGQDAVIVDDGANDAFLSSTEVTLTGGGKGASDYVDLPDGVFSGMGDSLTIEVWATQITVQNWSRIWDFGTSTTENVFMSWTSATNLNADRVEWVGPAGNSTMDNTNAPYELGVPYHIVTVFDGGRVTWYTARADADDLGPQQGTFTNPNKPSELNDTNCWIGQSQWPDNTANASFNEFRMWKGALTTEEMEKLHDLGPDMIDATIAYGPSPSNGATDVSRDTELGWTAGETAASHDIYFGTSRDVVAGASQTSPSDVLLSQGQAATTFDPGRLEFGQTCYWRVDEVESGGTIVKGTVWHFTVEPYSYPVTGVTATASSQSKPGVGPEKTVDGSGLNANDQHSTVAEDGWLSDKGPSAWIQYDLATTYKVDKMMVWNSNQALESLFGFGAKDVTVEYSTDADNWTTLGDYEFAQSPGSADYVGDIIVDFAGAPVRYVKLTITSNWGGIFQQYGLSEVRFYYVPVAAREANPAPGATDVDPREPLSWRAGREAAAHEVYVGSDPNAVADGAVAPIAVTTPSCDAGLNLDATYYWKVAEINEVETYTTWDSPVWSFTTAHYVSIDDFESYGNNSPYRVFQAWIDGGGFSADAFFPNGNPGNGTGSFAGYDPALGDIMEFVNVLDGTQSMPLYYDNSASPKISEATRTFATPQDWTKHGVTTLVLFFYGDPTNSAAPVYVKINDTSIPCPTISTTKAMWQQWNIPLASVSGLNLTSVKSLAVGVGDGVAGGTGTIFVDAVRLYAAPPEVAVPTDPGTNGLAALYAMEGNVQDSSGNNLHGTANGEPGYVDGPAGMGQALAFDGVNDFVDLPVGDLIGTLEDATFAVWVNYANAAGGWQRVFDFSISTSINMFLTPDANNDNMRFAITLDSSAGEQQLNSPRDFPAGWHHAAVVMDSATMTETLYIDGTPVDSQPTTLLPKDLGVTTTNRLGRSVYTTDAYYNGSIDDFRIYDRVLSEGEIRYLAGDR